MPRATSTTPWRPSVTSLPCAMSCGFDDTVLWSEVHTDDGEITRCTTNLDTKTILFFPYSPHGRASAVPPYWLPTRPWGSLEGTRLHVRIHPFALNHLFATGQLSRAAVIKLVTGISKMASDGIGCFEHKLALTRGRGNTAFLDALDVMQATIVVRSSYDFSYAAFPGRGRR